MLTAYYSMVRYVWTGCRTWLVPPLNSWFLIIFIIVNSNHRLPHFDPCIFGHIMCWFFFLAIYVVVCLFALFSSSFTPCSSITWCSKRHCPEWLNSILKSFPTPSARGAMLESRNSSKESPHINSEIPIPTIHLVLRGIHSTLLQTRPRQVSNSSFLLHTLSVNQMFWD